LRVRPDAKASRTAARATLIIRCRKSKSLSATIEC